MGQKLYLRVGTTDLGQCENSIQITKQSLIGQTGYRQVRRETWTIIGWILDANQTTLNNTMGARESLFATDGQDLRWKFADGTDTQHVLLNSSTMNGVRFKNFQWMGGNPGVWGAGPELATVRTYRVTAEADVLDQESSDLFFWHESVKQIGHGGPDFAYPENLLLPPTRQDTKNYTRGALVQSGTAIGFTAYPVPNAPYFPGLLKPKSFQPVYDTPKQFGRQRHSYFPVHWSYYFESDVAIPVGPPVLPAP